MQSSWFLEVSGASPKVYRVFSTDQLVLLNATLLKTHLHAETELDQTAARLHDELPGAGLPQMAFFLCAKIVPAEYDTSYDAYTSEPSDVILASFRMDASGQPAVAISRPVKFHVRAGSTLSLSITCSCTISADWLSKVTVHCSGVLLNGVAAHTGWRPVIQKKWFTVKPTVQETSVKVAPPHILAPHMRAGQVGEARCVSSCGKLVQWTNGVQSLLSEVTPYRRVFTPCRSDKTVRIRRYPHRNADVVGEVPFNTQLEAIGQAVDDTEGEVYVLWKDGGWSRVAGSNGPFLVESQLSECEVFQVPRLFTSARDGRGVRIRNAPSLKAKQIGEMEPNEVREAIAIHADHDINAKFVEWKSGGYSCLSGLHGNFLVEITPTHQALRAPPLRAPRGPPSPEIVAFDRRKASKRSVGDGQDSSDGDLGVPEAQRRRMESRPVDSGISPSLVPQGLKENVASGKVALSNLPAVSLREGSSDEGSEEDEEDSEWSDENDFSSDDYDDDAFDDDSFDDDDDLDDDDA